MFTHLSVPKVLFFFSTRPCHSSLLPRSPFVFIPVIISCIQAFRGLPLPLLPGGHHSQTLLGILSSWILLMCPYQFSCSFSNLSVTSPNSQLIPQLFRRFIYVTAHSPTLPLLHLRHSSFSNPSFASPTSQALHLRHLASRSRLEQTPCSPDMSSCD